jgi:hypothetical protein
MTAQEKRTFNPTLTPGAQVIPLGEGAWRLEIPAGPQKAYRVAQIDDYGSQPRRSFSHRPPFRFSLQARASAEVIPGTWGMGLWNNPFSMAILSRVEILRLPALPETAWFFFASPPNYLSFRDDLSAEGALAATFRSRRIPTALFALGAPALPLLRLPPAVRLARRLARQLVQQSSVHLDLNPTGWHSYAMEWLAEGVTFWVDGEAVHQTSIAPHGPLGLAIWVDNQYAALPPNGRVGFGALENPQPAWIEIKDLDIVKNAIINPNQPA